MVQVQTLPPGADVPPGAIATELLIAAAHLADALCACDMGRLLDWIENREDAAWGR